ncbi:hypothetical protein JCM10003_1801 [Bacteroides pyogenes JCM 10003]|nr:hypothetical protein JCM10003_1801 [Bacteroides pyogenes JCM 10003]SUV32513.1 Uncharacterised protein [Bacteroides pyogenes]
MQAKLIMKKKTFILLLLSGTLSCQAQAWKTLKSVLGKSIELRSNKEALFNKKLKTNEQVKRKENYLEVSGVRCSFYRTSKRTKIRQWETYPESLAVL